MLAENLPGDWGAYSSNSSNSSKPDFLDLWFEPVPHSLSVTTEPDISIACDRWYGSTPCSYRIRQGLCSIR